MDHVNVPSKILKFIKLLTTCRRVNEGVFLMTAQPRPILVEMIESRDEEDGLAEKSIHKNNPMIMKVSLTGKE